MGDTNDTGGPKSDVKRRSNKRSKVNRIVSLFEIPRPNKTKGLQRTNSLPASKRPNTPLIHEETTSLEGYCSTTGNVQRIKEEIEQKTKQKDENSTSKSAKKKTNLNKKKIKNKEVNIEDWLQDKKQIMEDLNKLHERIENVTQEIQNSDTELEITHKCVSVKDNMFKNSEEYEWQEVLPPSDEDSETTFNRLSSETVFTRLSSDTIKKLENNSVENIVDVSLMSCYGHLDSASADYKDIQDNEQAAFNSIISDTEELDPNVTLEPKTSAEGFQEWQNEEEINIAGNSEAVEDNEDTLGDDTTDINQHEITTELDSIEWWKHKSFVQINNEPKSEDTNTITKTVKNEDLEETAKYSEPSPALAGRFIKNNRNKRAERRRTGIIKKPFSVKELANRFEGFKDAAESGETENFRKSFIDEMDKELENMKNDGFREDFHLSFENLTLLNYDDDGDNDQVEDSNVNKAIDDEAVNMNDLVKSEEGGSSLFQTIIIFPNSALQDNEYELFSTQDQDDVFGETLFGEDLENGLYYLETYNADGKELIMCSVQIDRQSVDLNSFDKIRAQSSSNVLADGEKTLVLMEGGEASSLNEDKSGTDSKRTTIYSTTSGESYEDEGIDIENASYGYSAARRETYCDDQGIVRIERVAPYPENSEEPSDYINTSNHYYYVSQEENNNNGDNDKDEENYYDSINLEDTILSNVPEIKKETLQYILEEIRSTERKFVFDMRKVLTEYKTFLEERCPEKVDVVFANMEQLYGKQLEFLQVLEDSGMDLNDVVQAFVDFEDLFRLYPRYFKNTPKANAAIKELGFLIKEKQERINDKLHLSAYLLTPLQRLGKYKLFLENIIKQLDKEQRSIGAAQMALDIIKKYMSKGNDAVAIASILHSPLHTKDYGSFITREKFPLIKPKRLELMVFLFEGAIVFTTEDPKNMEEFVYHQSIKTNDLRIATYDDTTIHLMDYTKTKRRNSSRYTYILDAKSPKLKAYWKQQIEDILWKQMMKMKENTLKEYQSGNKTPKKAARKREERSKSIGSSVFYVE